MRRVRALGVTIVVVPLLFIGSAPQAAARSPRAIDCPPRASLDHAGIIADRRGSDVSARATLAAVWRLDGVITDLAVGGRTLEIDGVTLYINSRSVILVDCKRAAMRELREGSSVTVLYEERASRNVVIVIEGQSDDR